MLFLFLVAVGARLAGLLVVGHPELLSGAVSLTFDEPSYHRLARTLVETGRYALTRDGPPSAYRSPGMILTLAGFYSVFGTSPLVGLACVLVLSVALVGVVRLLALATLDDRRAVNFATAIAALMPTFLWTSAGIWSEPLTLLAMLTTLLLLVGKPPSEIGPGRWAAIGLSIALAYLVRASIGVAIPLLLLFASSSGSPRQRAVRTLAFVVAVALPVSAWGLRNYLVMGRFFTSATVAGHTLWEANNPVTAGIALPAMHTYNGFDLYEEARSGAYVGSWVPRQYVPGSQAVDADSGEFESYDAYVALVRRFISDHPGAALQLLVYKLERIFTAEPVAPSISTEVGTKAAVKRMVTFLERWFLLAFGVPGLVMLWRSNRQIALAYGVFVLAGLASVMLAYVNARFVLPVTAVLIVPAALTVSRLTARLWTSNPVPQARR